MEVNTKKVNTKKQLPPEEQFNQDKKEAMDPEVSKDFVMLGTKRLQIRILHYLDEERIVDLVGQSISEITNIEGVDSVGTLVMQAKSQIYKALPEAMVIIFEDQGITPEWLQSKENRVSSVQMYDALMAQLEKNGLADRLGKLFMSGALQSVAALMSQFISIRQPKPPITQ